MAVSGNRISRSRGWLPDGTIAIVDFRLLGLVLPRWQVSQLAAELKPFTLTGIAIMLTTGPLMLSAAPERGYGNPAFAFKMSFLLLALTTHFSIHRRATMSDRMSGTSLGGKLVACVHWSYGPASWSADQLLRFSSVETGRCRFLLSVNGSRLRRSVSR